jgi:DNA-binding transcriptional ArsR family regulator
MKELHIMEEHKVYDLAEFFKAFSDSTRVKILLALFEKELNVSQIVEKIGVTQTAASHQLRSLKQSHLVRCRRDGKNMYYSLADDHVKIIMNCAIEHIEE